MSTERRGAGVTKILGVFGGLIVGALAGFAVVSGSMAECEDIDCAVVGLPGIVLTFMIAEVIGAFTGGAVGSVLGRRLRSDGAPERRRVAVPGRYDLILVSPGRKTPAVWRILRNAGVPEADATRALEDPPAAILRDVSHTTAEGVRGALIGKGATVEIWRTDERSPA